LVNKQRKKERERKRERKREKERARIFFKKRRNYLKNETFVIFHK